MKILYKKANGTVVAMGECDFTADALHDVDTVPFDIPNDELSNYKRTAPGVLVRKDALELDADATAKDNTAKAEKAADLALLGWSKEQLRALRRLLKKAED